MDRDQAQMFMENLQMFFYEVTSSDDPFKGGIFEKMKHFLELNRTFIGLDHKSTKQKITAIEKFTKNFNCSKNQKEYISQVLQVYTEGSNVGFDEEMLELMAFYTAIKGFRFKVLNYSSMFQESFCMPLFKELDIREAECKEALICLLSDQEGDSKHIFLHSSFRFRNIANWDKELDMFAKKFKKENGFWPMLMMASSATYKRIDLVANQSPKHIKGGPKAKSPAKFVSLSGFQGEEYSLEMCIDEAIPELSLRLVFDTSPDGENEPMFKKSVLKTKKSAA